MQLFPFQVLLKSLTWSIKTSQKEVFLTFDDGPIEGITPWVVDLLNEYNAKATFFCVGENVKKNCAVYNLLLSNGHSVGNHTMQHLNGWKYRNSVYYQDIKQAETFINSNLFRPPYGKIRPSQIYRLKKEFKIIMWDILTKDYDSEISGMECFEKVKRNVKPGSIIVFHDSIKAEKRLRIALPLCLEYLKNEGYIFSAIK